LTTLADDNVLERISDITPALDISDNQSQILEILEPSCKKRQSKQNAKSGVWKFFQVHKDWKLQQLAFCKLCDKDVNYTVTKSTGMLTRHVRVKHSELYDGMLEGGIGKEIEN
jgi:hypothetical protein